MAVLATASQLVADTLNNSAPKPTDADEDSETTTSELKNMDPQQRLAASNPLSKCLQARNMRQALINVKRGKTTCAADNSERTQDVADHYSYMVSACELPLNRMLATTKEIIATHIANLKKPYPKLPQLNYAELCCRWTADDFRGKRPIVKVDKVLSRLSLYKTAPQTDCDTSNPVMWSNHFDRDDRPMHRRHWVKQLVAQVHRKRFIFEHALIDIIRHVEGYPHELYLENGDLRKFLARMKGLLLLVGTLHFMEESCIGDIESISNTNNESPLQRIINENAWLKQLLIASIMRNSGESLVWPEVVEIMNAFGTNDRKQVSNAIASALGAYPKFRTSYRETVLPATTDEKLVQILVAQVEESSVSAAGSIPNLKNPDLVSLLGHVRAAAGFISDPNLQIALVCLISATLSTVCHDQPVRSH